MSCQNNSVCPVAFLSLLSGLTTCPHVELCSILCRSGCSMLGLPPLPVHPWGSMPLTVAQITSHSASLHCLRSQQLLPAWIAGRTSKGEAWQPCCSCLTACSLKWRRASHTVLILRWGANMRAALRGTCSCHREEQMWCAGSGAGILAVMVVASWGAEWRCMGTCTRTSSPSSCWAMNAACCLLSLCLWLLWLRMGQHAAELCFHAVCLCWCQEFQQLSVANCRREEGAEGEHLPPPSDSSFIYGLI